jgi:hypothetical protein
VLLKRVREIMTKLQKSIANIILEGVQQKQIRKDVKADVLALRILSHIEGGIFITHLMNDENHMKDVMDQIDAMIEAELLM